jgi:hypothetical protein
VVLAVVDWPRVINEGAIEMKTLQLIYVSAVIGLIIFLAGCTAVGALQGTPPSDVRQPGISPLAQAIPSVPPTCPPVGATEHCFFVPTSLPDQGVRVSPPTELTLIEGVAPRSSGRLFSMALSGDTLVGATKESDQIKLYVIDLNSGQMRQIGTSNPGVAIMRTSGQYIVWNRDEAEILAYDLQANKEIYIAPGKYPDMSGRTVVWIDLRNVHQGDLADIYGYDLSLEQEFPVIVRPGRQTQPKIAGQWVAYLEIVGEMDYRLRVHHISTGEDFEIGAVPVFIPPSFLVAAQYFAISGNHLAWVSAQNSYEIHVYDLDTRTDRVILKSETSLHDILLDGDILLYDGGKGYDLSLNVSFSIPPMGGEWLGAGGSPLLLSGDRLVWTVEKDTDQIRHLFTARIVRDK